MTIRQVLILAALLLGGCSAQAAPSATAPAPVAPVTYASATRSLASSPTAVPATPAATTTGSPNASAAASVIYAGCSVAAPCVMTPGIWVTAGSYPFLRGLTLTVPSHWVSQEQDVGEFKLNSVDHPDDQLMLWKDVAAISSDGSTKVVAGIPRTAAGLTAYFKGNTDYVVSDEGTATIADGIPAQTYVVAVSKTAKFKLKDCPAYPRCADLITNPEVWAPGIVFGIGAPEVVRLYLATVGGTDDPHLFVIALDAPNAAELERFEKIAEPVIASIRLPAVLGDQ